MLPSPQERQAQSRKRRVPSLLPHALSISPFSRWPGMVKALSLLSPAEWSVLGTEVVLLPDKSGPDLLPASSLVYNNANWLTPLLGQYNLNLVHPEVGDEVIH